MPSESMNTTTAGLSDPSDSARAGDTTAHTPGARVEAEKAAMLQVTAARMHLRAAVEAFEAADYMQSNQHV